MEILEWGWTLKDESNTGWFEIECGTCMYSMYIENGIVRRGIYTDGDEYKSVYPYRFDSKLNCYVNCSGEYTLDYFKRLLKAGKIILK